MLFIQIVNGKAKLASTEFPKGSTGWQSRHDWPTYERAQQVACELNEVQVPGSGVTYVATDAGPHCSPRYDVIELLCVGDAVSYSFNGDTYPDGYIVSVSKSMKVITTDTGSRYYRRRLTGAWVKDGTWSLVAGHRHELNPSF